jgi:hypothetical protein
MSKDWKKCTRDSFGTLKRIAWVRSVNLGLRFSVAPKRFLPFLFSDIAAMLVIAMIMLNNDTLTEMAYSGAALPAEAVGALLWGVVAFGAWMVVNVWITGAMIHQSRNPDEYSESWAIACKRLPTLVLVLITVSLISLAVSMIPYVGAYLSLIVAMAFLFVNQFIILDGTGFTKSLSSSVLTFRSRLLAVFVAWMVSAIFVTLIISVFTIPLVAAFFTYGSEYVTDDLVTAAMMNPDAPWILVSGFVLMLGVAISEVFAVKYLTEIYLQFRKKKWLA